MISGILMVLLGMIALGIIGGIIEMMGGIVQVFLVMTAVFMFGFVLIYAIALIG
jgi:hypothetical protein